MSPVRLPNSIPEVLTKLKLSEAAVWEPAERWTSTDASELYDVASWGKGYFSVGETATCWCIPPRSRIGRIDLRELVEKLELRGISLPILIRFADILKHRLGEMHQAFQNSIARARLQGRLMLRLPDQGEPAAAGGGRSLPVRPAVSVRPRSRVEAGAAGGAGHRRQRNAHHLQRLQGRRVHRDGDAGQEDRPADHSGSRKVHGAGSDPEAFPARRGAAGHRAPRQAGEQRLRAVEILGRVSLEVRADRYRSAARRSIS